MLLWAPDGVGVANTGGHWLAKDARDNSLIIRASLEFPDGFADWRLRFLAHGDGHAGIADV